MRPAAAIDPGTPTVQALLAAARRHCADNSAAAGDCALLLALGVRGGAWAGLGR
jgi:hypothetical protein